MTPKPQTAAPDRRDTRVQSLATVVAPEPRRRLDPNTRVIWFGSRAQGRAQPHSDIDLALDVPAPFSPQHIAALRTWVDVIG
jgi:predicted nucleotidyltransferase